MATLAALLAAGALVGGLELLDRTNFALIGLAARRPGRSTWAGAASAFVLVTALGVLLGTLLVGLVGPNLRYVELAGGIVLLLYAGHLLREPEAAPVPARERSAFLAAFVLIALLELGDTTMVLVVLLTGALRDPLGVFLAASLALSGVSAFAVTIGRRLRARLDPRTLRRVVVLVLFLVGAATILVAIDPTILPPLFG